MMLSIPLSYMVILIITKESILCPYFPIAVRIPLLAFVRVPVLVQLLVLVLLDTKYLGAFLVLSGTKYKEQL